MVAAISRHSGLDPESTCPSEMECPQRVESGHFRLWRGGMRVTDAMVARMSELDDLVEQSRGLAPFADGVVRDTSNRSGRDWPWWSIQVEQTEEDGAGKRRVSATVRLNSTQTGEPGSFEGDWMARVWQGVSEDSFRARGRWPLPWEKPTAQDLQDAITALLDAANAAMSDDQKVPRS
jgi:hypothetical protein